MVPLNQSVKFGVITGMALIAYTVVLYVTDTNLFNPVFSILNGIINFGLMIFMAVFAINKTRDLQLEGKISWLQAFIAGVVMLLITMYVNSIFSLLLNEYIDPEYLPRQLDNFMASMEGKLPEDKLEEIRESVEENAGGMKAFIKGLWMSPIVALVVSAIISLFIKKDKTAEV